MTGSTSARRNWQLNCRSVTVPDRRRRNVDAFILGLVLCARLVGQTINLSMHELPVNVAYVIDDSQLGDLTVVFTKCSFAAIGFATSVH